MLDTYNDPSYNSNSPYRQQTEEQDYIKIIDKGAFDALEDKHVTGFISDYVAEYTVGLCSFLDFNNIEYKVINL